MPRRRTAERTGPVRTRTRSGCQTCRSRKIRCDEAKPRCRNCVARGLACNRELRLKWEPEFAARGLSFGREGVWCKQSSDGGPSRRRQSRVQTPNALLVPPSIELRHFINTYISDFDPDSDHEQGLGNETSDLREQSDASASALVLHSQPRPSLIPSLSSFPALNSFDQSLFEYYLLRLCPLTTPSTYLPSPFTSLIAPLFTFSGQGLVVQSVLAFAARHRSIANPRWARAAMKMKGNVLHALLQKIRSPDITTDVILDPQVPAAMMFLCLYEILDNCDHRWVIHLQASQDFMRKRQQLLLPSSQGSAYESLAAFAERYFAYQDVISRTACGNSPLFGLEYWQKPDQSEDIDTWMGCSPAMASVIFRITELARARDRDGMSETQFADEVAALDSELAIVSSKVTPIEALDDTIRQCAKLKKSSVEVYFHCLLRHANPSTPHVSRLVVQVLLSIQELVKQGCVAGMLFPLFVAAVELNPLGDGDIYGETATPLTSGRRVVLETLHAMAGVSLANIERTKAVILKVWRMRDLHAHDDQPATRKENDWHTFVSPYTQNLSLA
ncbi:hypothetical protein FZEAL_9272 [Fusarium zealandicum]|uniref:Zn(2)-C6 fungal-type domain-containing protein n=1 Tax=Fusarium zealandicum TaxID=1053134 RepID=A0A8H4XFW5_9HYPO|nr:hypothetical protein FZEAL_9272 [Fusarium zealandicum]